MVEALVVFSGFSGHDEQHHLGDQAVAAKMVPHANDGVLADSACQTLLGFEAARCWLSRNLTLADGGNSRSSSISVS